MNENKLNNISAIGKNCVGCRSCEQSCPQKCIYIKENTEGFLYPVIDAALCLNCGLCLCKCPEFHERVPRIPLSYYGLKEKEKKDIKNSASGGASDLAAKAILDRNGVVYGAAYNKDMRVVHIEVFDDEGRKAIQSSKYVQSDINNCYTKAKEQLKKGKLVLFTGTPCQIAGLYSFLGKDEKNLYTLDLICHGVPSPKLFEKYLNYQEKKLGEKIVYYNFRSKEKRGWGTYYLMKTETKTREKIHSLSLDKYGKNFMNGNCYRECCYQCRYANINRTGDITVGDFWGIEDYNRSFSSLDGVSSVIINTKKGMHLFEWMKQGADIFVSKREAIEARQDNLKKPTARPKERTSFYNGIENENYFKKIKVGFQLKSRVKELMPVKLIRFFKRILRKVR